MLRIAVTTDADGEQLTAYDLDAYDQTGEPVVLKARIEYDDNSQLNLTVFNADDELKVEPDAAVAAEDRTALYMPVGIVSAGAIASAAAFAFNKNKVDNAKWFAPLLISLNLTTSSPTSAWRR